MSATQEETQAAPDTEPEAPITEEQVQEAQEPTPADPGEQPFQAPVTTPTPEEGEEAEETPGTDDEPVGEPVAPDTEEAEAQTQAFSEKEIEKRLEKISRENDRHTKRVEEIMEEGATDLLQCPLCSHFVAGWIYPPQLAPLPEEAVDSSLAVLGFLKPRALKHASDTETCPECEGEGDVETGSKRQGYETKACGRCGQTGYVGVGQPVNGNGYHEHPEGLTGATTFAQDVSSDPAVQALRDRGFIVVPPVQTQTGVVGA